jgi:PAS domain S-box-containing protein
VAVPGYGILRVDQAGTLWLYGYRQPLHRAPAGRPRAWQPVTTPLGSDAEHLYDQPSGLWGAFLGQLGGAWGLGRYRDGNWDVYPMRAGPGYRLVGGSIAFVQHDALQIIPPESGAGPTRLTLPHPGQVTAVVRQRNGDLWVGLDDTVYRYRPDGAPPRTLVGHAEATVLQGQQFVVPVTGRERYRPQANGRTVQFSWRVDGGPWQAFRYLNAARVEVPTETLPPGDHSLEVRSQDEDGDVDPAPPVVPFTVVPLPLQQRAWFLPSLLALLLGVSALGGYALLARRRIAGHAHELAVKVRERTRELEEEKAALRRSEERFQLAAHGAAEGLWDWNLATGEVYCSPRFRELLGCGDALWPGVPELLAAVVPAEDRDRVLAALSAHLERRVPFDLEHRLRRPGHDGCWVRASGQGQWDAAGKPRRMVGSVSDITARKRAEEQVLASLREKEALLKEIHHRVKNNLQVVTSLLHLQADQLREPAVRAAFAETQNRIRSMALLHEQLYRSQDLARIDLREYVTQLCDHLLRTYGMSPNRVTLDLSIADLTVDLDLAIPCGLIINELVSNALKYAFPDGRCGRVEVRLQPQGGGEYALTVRDDGIGLPDNAEGPGRKTLGLQLVQGLVAQLRGTCRLHRCGGTTAVVVFPIQGPEPH